VSLYTPDANSLEAEKLFGVPDEIVISSLSVLEFTNAVELRVMRQEISLASAEASIKAFRADIESGIYRYRAVPPASYETGSMLARRYTRQFRVRSLDILHVAIALELGAAAFLTFDQAQRRLAHAAGMKVRPK
jgi:predicted nucleic acid-binding protein